MTVPTPAPDPHPEPISPPAPQGGWDCHAHIFGPSTRFPFAEGRGYTPPDAPPAKFLRHLDMLGLRYGVVVQANAHGFDNRAMLAALRAFPERLRGVAITPAGTRPGDLLEWHRAGVRGLRFHLFHPEHRPHYQRGVGWEAVDALLPTMRELGWHAQFWVDARALPAEEARLARLAAQLPVVLDHLGETEAAQGMEAPGFQALLRLLREHGAWAKLSAPYRMSHQGPDYPDAAPLYQAVQRTAPERTVWGSDWPHPQIPEARMPNDGRLLNLLIRWIADPAEQERVLVTNPHRLYGA